MPSLTERLTSARPRWPEAPDRLEREILASLGLEPEARSAGAWLRRTTRSRRARLLAVGLILAGAGSALAVAIAGRSGPAQGPTAAMDFTGPEPVWRSPFIESDPRVAVDGSGRVYAAWGRAGRALVASRSVAGAWSPASSLGSAGARASQPAVAAGRSGTVVVWRERIRAGAVTQRFTPPGGGAVGTLTTHVDVRWRVMAVATKRGGLWSAPEPILEASRTKRDGYAPQVVVTGAGDAIAGYVARGRAWTVRHPAGGSWAAPSPLGPMPATGSPSDLRLAAAPTTGWALATWLTYRTDPRLGRRWQIWAAARAPGGDWEGPHAVSGPSSGKPAATGAINDGGEAVVAWSDGPTRAVTRDKAGDWGTPAEVAPEPGDRQLSGSPVVGVDGEGAALVAATGRDGSALSRRTPDEEWAALDVLPSGTRITTIAADPRGALVIAGRPEGGAGALVVRLPTGDGARTTRMLQVPRWTIPWTLVVGADGTSALLTLGNDSRDTLIDAWVAEKEGHR